MTATTKSKPYQKGTLISTVQPITCFDDLVRLPAIPTKLNNLKLPPKKKENKTSLSARRKPPKRFPPKHTPRQYDVIVSGVSEDPNTEFLLLVRQSLPNYLTSNQQGRKSLVNTIIMSVTDRGGCFLKKTSTVFVEVDMAAAARFTNTALQKAAESQIPVNLDGSVVPIRPRAAPEPPEKTVAARAAALQMKFRRPARKVSLETKNPLEILSQVAAFDYEELSSSSSSSEGDLSERGNELLHI